MQLFITGSGTGVGKTLVAAGLASAWKAEGRTACVYKPVQTGSPDANAPDDPETVQSLAGSGVSVACSYCFPLPLAPYAADTAGIFRIEKILEDFNALKQQYDVVLVEGAGGIRVPLAPNLDMADLMQRLALPTIVVTTAYLGSLNHTLLSVEALQHRQIPVAGVIVSNTLPPETHLPAFGADGTAAPNPITDLAASTFEETLYPFLDVPFLGTIPYLERQPGLFQDAQARLGFQTIVSTHF